MPNAPELARGRSAPFVATDGTAYLYWKNDGNAVGKDTWISVQRLSADGLRLEGEPKRLLRQDLLWARRPSPAGATQLPPLLLGQRLRQRRVRGGTRHRVVADRTVHEGPRTGPDEHRRRGRSGALRDARDPRTAGCSWSTTRGRPTRSARRSSAARCGSARSPSTDARSASRRHGRNCPPASDRPLTMRPDRHVLAEASTFPVSVRTSSAWISLGRNAVAPVTLE